MILFKKILKQTEKTKKTRIWRFDIFLNKLLLSNDYYTTSLKQTFFLGRHSNEEAFLSFYFDIFEEKSTIFFWKMFFILQ